MSRSNDPRQSLQCMEVWGGNQPIRNGIGMAGIDAFVFSQPLGGTRGGDLYYLSSCASGRVSRLLLADIAGHGESVASLAEDLRTLLRKYVNWIDQRRLFEDVNRAFTEQQRTEIFATSIAATWFAPAHTIWISSAGHPMPAMYRAATDTWRFLPAGRDQPAGPDQDPMQNLPLGIEKPTRYDARGLRLRPGDTLVFFTDAVPEARSASGEQFGYERLLETMKRCGDRSPAGIITALERALLTHQDGVPPDDDLTILVICRNNSEQTFRPVSERLAFPGLFLRAVTDRLLGRAGPIPWPQWSIANIGGSLIDRLNRIGLPPIADDDRDADAQTNGK